MSLVTPLTASGRIWQCPLLRYHRRAWLPFVNTVLPTPAQLSEHYRQLLANSVPSKDKYWPGLSFIDATEVALDSDQLPYELHINQHHQVPTRRENLHDFFNAISWCQYPQTKRVLNQLHVAQIKATGTRQRGLCRDGLTQFDECGALLLTSSMEIIDALQRHQWQEVFWQERQRFIAEARLLIFGHAIAEALLDPYVGLTGKVLFHHCSGELLKNTDEQLVFADDLLADYFIRIGGDFSPACLKPLPLMGVPGVCDDNADAEYYHDERQFRPPPVVLRLAVPI